MSFVYNKKSWIKKNKVFLFIKKLKAKNKNKKIYYFKIELFFIINKNKIMNNNLNYLKIAKYI